MIEGLKSGDLIAISASARKLKEAELEPAIAWMKSHGWEAYYTEDLFEADHQLAGSDEHRAKLMQSYIDKPEIKAIWNARGGYGSVKMVDQLNWEPFAKRDGILMGFSDVTVLHMDYHKRTGKPSLHCTMPISVPENTKMAMDELASVLKGNHIQLSVSPHALNKEGNCQGKLIGGNLSVLYSILNSPSDFDWSNCILFIEDLDEYLYHIDRMLQNIKRTGKLKNLAGMVVGGLTDMNDNTVPWGASAEEIIAETLKEYDFPVLFDLPAGHINQNMPLWLGTSYSLQVDALGGKLIQNV